MNCWQGVAPRVMHRPVIRGATGPQQYTQTKDMLMCTHLPGPRAYGSAHAGFNLYKEGR